MKERIIALLKRLGITLPEGWYPDKSDRHAYRFKHEDQAPIEVELKPDFSLKVWYMTSDLVLHQIDIPYEVMQALYVEVGRVSLNAEEYAHARDELEKYKEVLAEANALASKLHSAQNVCKALQRKDELRRWHFLQLKKAKSELVKVSMRLHRQRARNKALRKAVSQ